MSVTLSQSFNFNQSRLYILTFPAFFIWLPRALNVNWTLFSHISMRFVEIWSKPKLVTIPIPALLILDESFKNFVIYTGEFLTRFSVICFSLSLKVVISYCQDLNLHSLAHEVNDLPLEPPWYCELESSIRTSQARLRSETFFSIILPPALHKHKRRKRNRADLRTAKNEMCDNLDKEDVRSASPSD